MNNKRFSVKDGLSYHPLYATWNKMIRRCYSEKDSGWVHYGAKGIKVTTRWHDFENFITDMYEYWKPDLTLERKNVFKDYGPENCEWITIDEQQRNKQIYATNKTGVAGTRVEFKKNTWYILARVQFNKVRKSKRWSIRRLGYEEALKEAQLWLTEQYKALGFGETHGANNAVS